MRWYAHRFLVQLLGSAHQKHGNSRVGPHQVGFLPWHSIVAGQFPLANRLKSLAFGKFLQCFGAVNGCSSQIPVFRERLYTGLTMRSLRRRITIGLLLFAPLAQSVMTQGQIPTIPRRPPVDHRADHALRTGSGLDISLASLVEAEPRLEVTLRNVGETPLWLCLGFLYGDQYPVNVHLILTEPSGEVVPLNLRIPVAVNGRVDPMIVPLPSHAAFVLPIHLAQYRPSTSYRSLDLEPGRYRLSAWYEGSCEVPAQNAYPYPLWAGVLKSDETGFVLQRKLPAP